MKIEAICECEEKELFPLLLPENYQKTKYPEIDNMIGFQDIY